MAKSELYSWGPPKLKNELRLLQKKWLLNIFLNKSQEIKIGMAFFEIIPLGGICNSHIEYLPSFVFILLSTSTYMVLSVYYFVPSKLKSSLPSSLTYIPYYVACALTMYRKIIYTCTKAVIACPLLLLFSFAFSTSAQLYVLMIFRPVTIQLLSST